MSSLRLKKHSARIPYLYFIIATISVFTIFNKNLGWAAFPILLFAIPFIWQVLKPNKALNITLGITFSCLSSYAVIAYLLSLGYTTNLTPNLVVYAGIFVTLSFLMALWIIKNSLNKSF
jgi:hypothetical protein